MSLQQQTFDDVETAEEDTTDEDRPAWTPGDTGDSSQCLGCGNHVSQDFVRLFSDESGRVQACLNCTDKNKLAYHAAGLETPGYHDTVQGGL